MLCVLILCCVSHSCLSDACLSTHLLPFSSRVRSSLTRTLRARHASARDRRSNSSSADHGCIRAGGYQAYLAHKKRPEKVAVVTAKRAAIAPVPSTEAAEAEVVHRTATKMRQVSRTERMHQRRLVQVHVAIAQDCVIASHHTRPGH